MLFTASVVDDPNWADKLEAWSTFGSAIFTAAAVIVAFVVWRHDRRRQREDKLATERAQARLVLATVTRLYGNQADGVRKINFRLTNNSGSSIFDVRIEVVTLRLWIPSTGRDLGNCNGGTVVTDDLEINFLVPWPYGAIEGTVPNGRIAPPLGIIVSFTDSCGLRWMRDGLDEPRRILTVFPFPPIRKVAADYLGVTTALRRLQRLHRNARASAYTWLYRRTEARKRRQIMRHSSKKATADSSDEPKRGSNG